MTSSIRTFLALTLTEDARRHLRDLQERLAAEGIRVRWEPHDKLHITVRFLGDLQPDAVNLVTQKCEELASEIAPFDLVFNACGAFPDMSRPRVLWAGAFETSMLGRLGHLAEEAARSAGCTPERKAFHPHCTLARIRERDTVSNLTNAFASITFSPILSRSSDLRLVKSDLLPGGSRYSELASFPFNRYRSPS